ncbi:MAG: deoxyribodipyrimidine photo-lyase, partial [Ferruginibacter sp.]
AITKLLQDNGVTFQSFKDQVIFEKDEVLKADKKPYTVFTPYSRTWKSLQADFHLKPYPTEKYFPNFNQSDQETIFTLEAMGFKATGNPYPPASVSSDLLEHYQSQRNFPGTPGTSRLGIHLRFGTISIRELAAKAKEYSPTYLNELIWRDFYQMILWNFPQVGKGKSFKPAYDKIEWRNNEAEFKKWCDGNTGFPIVDAGMRELNETGFMHNRVRMITASFLCKDLLVDWRWGEAYFAEKLLDYDLAANNGGWQWASGSGCDSAPYFRVFNPDLQAKKFDKDLKYIRKYIPELDSFEYPLPIVDHAEARMRCLEVYAAALKEK